MIRWTKENYRPELLRTGMGCFVFGAAMTLFNMLVLPINRRVIGFHYPSCLIAFFAAIASYIFLGKVLERTSEMKLERIRRVAVPAFIIVLFIVQVTMGYLLEYTPAGDNGAVYGGAKILAENGRFDSTTEHELYFARFPNQWGFLLFCTLMWKVFGVFNPESIFMPLVVVQALLYIPGVLSALALARKTKKGVRAELMMLAMLVTCLPLYLSASVLYTDTFSMPFVPMAMNLAFDVIRETDQKRQIRRAIAFGVVVAVGSMIKMTVLIILMAAVICWALTIKPVRAFAYAAVCVLIFALCNSVMHQMIFDRIVARDLYEYHNTPAIHWVMMAIPSSGNEWGIFSYDYAITWGMMEEGVPREEIMASIYSRIKDKIYTLRYPQRLVMAALRKNISAFSDGTFGMSEMLNDGPVRAGKISDIVLKGWPQFRFYQGIASGIYYAHLFMALLGCVRDIRRRDVRMALGYVAAFGMMFFMMLWEARTRYFYGCISVILLLSCCFAADRKKENVL